MYNCIHVYASAYIYICVRFPCIPVPFPGPMPWQIVLCPGELFALCGGVLLSTEDPAVFLLLSLFRPAPAFRPPVLLLVHLVCCFSWLWDCVRCSFHGLLRILPRARPPGCLPLPVTARGETPCPRLHS